MESDNKELNFDSYVYAEIVRLSSVGLIGLCDRMNGESSEGMLLFLLFFLY